MIRLRNIVTNSNEKYKAKTKPTAGWALDRWLFALCDTVALTFDLYDRIINWWARTCDGSSLCQVWRF